MPSNHMWHGLTVCLVQGPGLRHPFLVSFVPHAVPFLSPTTTPTPPWPLSRCRTPHSLHLTALAHPKAAAMKVDGLVYVQPPGEHHPRFCGPPSVILSPSQSRPHAVPPFLLLLVGLGPALWQSLSHGPLRAGLGTKCRRSLPGTP